MSDADPQDDTTTGSAAHGGDHAVRGRDEALEDIARFVGHARPATAADYEDAPSKVWNHPGELESNAGSNRPPPPDRGLPDGGPQPEISGFSRAAGNRPGPLRGGDGTRTHDFFDATEAL
jgi:hypothetical protein